MKRRHDDVIIVFSESVHKTCQRQPTELKLSKLVVHSKFHKICKFENHVTKNDVIMMSLPETMGNNGEMQTYAKPNKLYINRKVLMRAIQKCTFIESEPLCQKFWVFCQMLAFFYHARSPNMIISRDPRSNFRKLFVLS